MSQSIVFTFIGKDKPGLVEKLATTVADHQGNWLESRMNHLAGQFAGITRVQVANEHADALLAALQALNGSELTVEIIADAGAHQSASGLLRLSIIGNDRPGIVREVSRALAARHISVYEMETNVVSAPMTAEPLFDASALIQCPDDLDYEALDEQLAEISDQLGVDISLDDA